MEGKYRLFKYFCLHLIKVVSELGVVMLLFLLHFKRMKLLFRQKFLEKCKAG